MSNEANLAGGETNDGKRRGLWIDVGALLITATEELRRIASDIMTDERKLECGHPRVNVTGIEGGGKTQTTTPKKGKT